MRLKNVKNAKEKVAKSEYIIEKPEEYKGNYKKVFKNENDIHLEIGMGKGNFIINMAKKYPDINFIGIEMFDSVIVRAVEKLESEEINNLKLIKFDATNIEDIFQNEISTIYLNFSDPWPKNRHEKRRLTSDRFLNKYEKIFKEKCHIIQKTDNRKLFEFSLMSYVNYGYKLKEISLDLNKDEKENVQTEYEDKFTNLGYPIYMVEVDKNLHKN